MPGSIDELLRKSGIPTREAQGEVENGAVTAYVHAGQFLVTAQPTKITTVLGSCVAICLHDAASRVGGLNHYMLPADVGGACESPRYARFAIDRLFAEMMQLGADLRRAQARLYGGASTMGLSGARELGLRNVDVARERLAAEGIRIVSEDVGGTHGRRLVYRTDTGLAIVTQIAAPTFQHPRQPER